MNTTVWLSYIWLCYVYIIFSHICKFSCQMIRHSSPGYLYILSLQHDFTKYSLIVPIGDPIFFISATMRFTFVNFNEMSFRPTATEFGSDIHVPLRMSNNDSDNPLNGWSTHGEGIGNYFHHFSKIKQFTVRASQIQRFATFPLILM